VEKHLFYGIKFEFKLVLSKLYPGRLVMERQQVFGGINAKLD
jgi:hypothetical protein